MLNKINEMEVNEIIKVIKDFDVTLLEELNIEELKKMYKKIQDVKYKVSLNKLKEYKSIEEEEKQIIDRLEKSNIDDNDILWETSFETTTIKKEYIKKEYNSFLDKCENIKNKIDDILFAKTNGEWCEDWLG